MKKRVSIKEIAKRAGTSHSTVSRALNNSPLISIEKREEIVRIADEMGYTPNAIAQSLQLQKTNTIGLVVSLIADPFWSGVVEGIEEVALAADKGLFLNSSSNNPGREIKLIEAFQRRRVDGILVASTKLGNQYLAWLEELQIPVVMINTQVRKRHRFHTVAIDDRQGIRLAMEEMLKLGHRRIGFLGIGNRPASNRRRLSTYRQMMKKAGLTPHEDWTIAASFGDGTMAHEFEVAQTHTPRLLEAGVTAIVCYNDLVALGVMQVCYRLGIRVPDQCSVCGFDDIEPARYSSPALTTVHQPIHEMGSHAMQMLLDLVDGKAVESKLILPSLVVRESTSIPSPD